MRAMNQFNSRKSTLAAAAALAMAVSLTLPVQARPSCEQPEFEPVLEGPKADRRFQYLSHALALTEEQVAQMTSLRETQRAALKAERQAMHAERQAFMALATSGANEAELKAQADAIAAKVSAHMVAKSLHLQSVRALLTPEQQLKMDALHARRAARKGGRHGASAMVD